MFACAAYLAGPAQIAGGHLSFRSHAEGFLSGAPALRPRFDAFADRFGDQVVTRIEAIDKALKKDATGRVLDPQLVSWFAMLLEAKSAIDYHVETLSPEDLEVHAPGTGAHKPGAFEKMVLNGALKRLRGNRQFISYRLLLSLVYGLLPMIGVKPVERFAICHLVAEAGTRIYRVDWRRHLSDGGGSGARLLGMLSRLTRGAEAQAPR